MLFRSDMLNKGAVYMYCPCIDCGNLKMFNNSAQIEGHLIRRGFKRGYTCWTSHGEEQIIQEVNNDDIVEEVKHLQITAINAWTVHKFYPLVQHILLGGSFKKQTRH